MHVQEEAEAITGCADPEAACQAVLQRRGAATQWCCVKLGSRGAVLRTRSPEAVFRQHALLVRAGRVRGGFRLFWQCKGAASC